MSIKSQKPGQTIFVPPGTNYVTPEAIAKKLAEAHVDWFLEVVRPLMLMEFVHGYKHGQEDANNDSKA